MRYKNSRSFLIFFAIVLFCLVSYVSRYAIAADTHPKPYYHLVILGDSHLPGKNLQAKEQVIRTINTWADLDMVVLVGDICESAGTDEEYSMAKNFFKRLEVPFYPIAGNHDYLYENRLSPKGYRITASPGTREAKLRTFRDAFGLTEVFYSKRVGQYLLIFLSTDHLHSDNLTEMSDRELAWLSAQLRKHGNTPTIIFFHAPLNNTLRNYSEKINTPTRIAQPSSKIHGILMDNPQVFLWVSGHTHTSPKEESFASPINVYETRVTNIHNTDMNRETIWTNSLYLYPERIVVKTFNHKKDAWLPEHQRTIVPPSLRQSSMSSQNYAFLFNISRAATMPEMDAWIRPRVTPAPSPTANRFFISDSSTDVNFNFTE
jgi:3',5'-cyclic-AMP phosphodiesterase